MPLEKVEYHATVRLVYEVVYEQPDQLGMRPVYKDQVDLWDEETDRLDERRLVAQCPEEAWGWFTQQRFDARIDHGGSEVQLTSMPTKRSGTSYLDATLVTIEEVLSMVEEQQAVVEKANVLDQPVGPLPHGSDKRALLIALQKGEEVVETRNGHYRLFDRARGDDIVRSEDL